MKNDDFENFEDEKVGEGWWQSIMQDDGSVAVPETEVNGQENGGKLPKSPQEVDVENDWELVNDLFQEEKKVSCDVIDFNKGGLIVNGQSFQGFVPISHMDDLLAIEDDLQREEKLKAYIGCRLFLKIIECDPRRGRIVLSERAAQTEPGQRQKLLEMLEVGKVLTGRVTNVTDFGVFVDLGGVEGLVHISELSWGRVIHPSQYASINETIEVLVLQINRDQCRVSLSIKRLKPNPWEEITTRYPQGTILDGTITEIVKFGAFARLEDGLEGLIHISEMGVDGSVTPDDLFDRGQHVKVEVVLVDPDRQRMSLRLVSED